MTLYMLLCPCGFEPLRRRIDGVAAEGLHARARFIHAFAQPGALI